MPRLIDDKTMKSPRRTPADSAADASALARRGATGTGGARPPRLVVMQGSERGPAYALEARRATDGQWVIGRRPGLAVSLPSDPYVSRENAVVRRTGERFTVEDLPESTNGTRVNGAVLRKGKAHFLQPEDRVGVGQSTLLFEAH